MDHRVPHRVVDGNRVFDGCASPPVDAHEQVELRLVWSHRTLSTSLNLPKQSNFHFCLKLTDHTPAEPLTRYTLFLDCDASRILTHQDSEFYAGRWKSVHPTCRRWRLHDTGGHRAHRTPDPGTDGLIHADTHLTMSRCAAQGVFVGLSPIFGPSSSSVDVPLSAFANIDHAVPLLYPPRPPALQPSSIPSL
ncbi:hypothetical protein BLNAU_3157 [Blattamonas nauphoetae]|uniref:Uncharacterized protein n=1 Tax=Blattamonas nauphoetae TaxID=2049346 RepID=A0ABQ9YD78_9EUKA|nr:hypothetical protein BLNAU_3157 [Blattamonas nauphoetae]